MPKAGRTQPFEVWVNGSEQPRGLGALARRSPGPARQRSGVAAAQARALATVAEEHAFEMPFQRTASAGISPGVVAATAAVVRWRCEALKALPLSGRGTPTPVMDAMFSVDEPHTGPSGTLAWAVDIDNPATGEAFTLTLKEVTLPGTDPTTMTRPCAIGFSGNYPRA